MRWISFNKVYKQAQKTLITQPQFDAKYVRRPRLKDYLPASTLKLEPKNRNTSRSDSSSSNLSSANEASMPKKTTASESKPETTAAVVPPPSTTPVASEAQNGDQSEANNTVDETTDQTMNMVSECESISENSECLNSVGADVKQPENGAATEAVEVTKNQLLTNVNSYEKQGNQSPATQIDGLSLDSADEVANKNGVKNSNNKRSISPTPPTDPSQKMPINKKPKEVPEEELLDTLPSNMQSLSAARNPAPPLSVVKNSIRVNIGANKK